jgi:hypothetical protein
VTVKSYSLSLRRNEAEGVAVEKKEASFEHRGRAIRVVDLPGTPCVVVAIAMRR